MNVFEKIKSLGLNPEQINFPDLAEVAQINDYSDTTGVIGEVDGIPVIMLTYPEFVEFVAGKP